MRSALNSQFSPFRQNMDYLSAQLGIDMDSLINPPKTRNHFKTLTRKMCMQICKTEEDLIKAKTIAELTDVIDNLSECVLNCSETRFIINSLSLN